MSSDGENVYAAAPDDECGGSSHCEDVAEFTRNADGSLTQLASPDNCIQDESAGGERVRQRERPRPRRRGRGHLA